MSDLSETSLEALLVELRKYIDETGNRTSIPTHFIYRPSDLEELGLTMHDVKKIIKEKNT